MNELSGKSRWWVAGLLAALLFFTRYSYFDFSVYCANASMAVFFVGGIYLRRHGFLAALMVLAFGIDYVAIRQGLVPLELITQASVFEPVAYALLWYVGRAGAAHGLSRFALIGMALLSGAVAFMLTNGSFYFLSGFFPTPSLAGWVANYFLWAPLFVGTTWAYAGAVLALDEAWERLNRLAIAHRAH